MNQQDKIHQTEPSSELREAAAAMWQMYSALVRENFTESQALTIIGHVIATGKRPD